MSNKIRREAGAWVTTGLVVENSTANARMHGVTVRQNNDKPAVNPASSASTITNSYGAQSSLLGT